MKKIMVIILSAALLLPSITNLQAKSAQEYQTIIDSKETAIKNLNIRIEGLEEIIKKDVTIMDNLNQESQKKILSLQEALKNAEETIKNKSNCTP